MNDPLCKALTALDCTLPFNHRKSPGGLVGDRDGVRLKAIANLSLFRVPVLNRTPDEIRLSCDKNGCHYGVAKISAGTGEEKSTS